MTKEEFNKLWKDSTRKEILNQYYYDYTELQNEVDRLSENNLAMQEEMARTWDKLQQKENIIKEVREWEKTLKYECISGSKHNKLLEILDKGE